VRPTGFVCEAPQTAYQAWVAHYLISQFGIDRVASEPKIYTQLFQSPLKAKYRSGEAEPDAVVTRRPGIKMPHYVNRLGKASDDSGLGLLKDLVAGGQRTDAAGAKAEC
jgi:hypothetical protein